jgi:hypothetical protein
MIILGGIRKLGSTFKLYQNDFSNFICFEEFHKVAHLVLH